VREQWSTKRPHYHQAKEVDEATLAERRVNFYKKQQEEEAEKKREI
jgi:hypothetical protein